MICHYDKLRAVLFQIAYGDENMYSIFALVLGVSQIIALAVFPVFRHFDERSMPVLFVVVSYVLFSIPADMKYIGVAGVPFSAKLLYNC